MAVTTESLTITHRCGHTASARLSGTPEQIAAKVAMYSARDCHACAHPAPAPRPVATAPAVLTAKYAARCPRCGGPIEVGDPIAWQPGSKATHAACGAAVPSGHRISRGPGRGYWVQDDESSDW